MFGGEVEGHPAKSVAHLLVVVFHTSRDEIDVCLEQVKAGFAWHYKKYQHEQSSEDQRLYAVAEANARDARLEVVARE